MKDSVKDALKRIDFGKDWWGEVLLVVRDGKVTLIKETQTTKLD
jgi:hypothetical protein